ncbi:hypothetical protein V2E24_03565, partial [Mycoplasmopsis ciconiae]|nr:hypothetical protein [Mycoplasmopsis ciconiae]
AWEQHLLGEHVFKVNDKNKDMLDLPALTVSSLYGLVEQNKFFNNRVASKDTNNYFIAQKGDFAYNKTPSAESPVGAIKQVKNIERGVLSPIYLIFRVDPSNPIDDGFLSHVFYLSYWYNQIKNVSKLGVRRSLTNIQTSDFFGTYIFRPGTLEEQQKVSKFFENIDSLITLHQRK